MRIPPERHPYPMVERALRSKDPSLGIVFNNRRGYWVVVQEVPHYVVTFPCLIGVNGVHGRWCRLVPVLDLYSEEKGAVNPAAYLTRILAALDQMSTRRFRGLDGFLENLYQKNEDERQRCLRQAEDYRRYQLKNVAKRWGKIISTPCGTIDVEKMYRKHIPIEVEGQRIWREVPN